jgi:hypothetical protein
LPEYFATAAFAAVTFVLPPLLFAVASFELSLLPQPATARAAIASPAAEAFIV